MKIIDIRKTSEGWMADVFCNPRAMLPISVPISECTFDELVEFANTDPDHIVVHKRTLKSDSIRDEWLGKFEGYRIRDILSPGFVFNSKRMGVYIRYCSVNLLRIFQPEEL